MVFAAYAFLTFLSVVAGALSGVAYHYFRSNLLNQDRVSDNDAWNSLDNHAYPFEKHVLRAEWNKDHSWNGLSNRNLLLMAAVGAVIPIILSMVLWPDHAEIVQGVCSWYSTMGGSSPLCPA
jgi:hypothetical protein